MKEKPKCSICSGTGSRYTQPYSLQTSCDICSGTGYFLDLGELFAVQAARGEAELKIAKITGRKLLGN